MSDPRHPKVFDGAFNLTAHLVGTCAEAQAAFGRIQPEAATPLNSGEHAVLAMHCSSLNELVHEPGCPACDPRQIQQVKEYEPPLDPA